MDFSVSARGKGSTPIKEFLENYYPSLDIKSVFGFVERSKLYGGRKFLEPEISPSDVEWLYDNGIGLKLPVSGECFDVADIESERSFFEKYHREGNSVIVTLDILAEWIRDNFPKYSIEASSIRNGKDSELYDTITLPSSFNRDDDFLRSIGNKDRIRLFANAACAFNCPNKSCYYGYSRMNYGIDQEDTCSLKAIERPYLGETKFNISHYASLGFSKFKAMASVPRFANIKVNGDLHKVLIGRGA